VSTYIALAAWIAICVCWDDLNAAGERLGWVFYRGAMRRMEYDRKRAALHASIVRGFVRSSDSYGLVQYLGAAHMMCAAGQQIYVPEQIIPIRRVMCDHEAATDQLRKGS
jgi:hypothetical protein